MTSDDRDLKNLNSFEILEVLDDIILEEKSEPSEELSKMYIKYASELVLKLFPGNDYLIIMADKIKKLT